MNKKYEQSIPAPRQDHGRSVPAQDGAIRKINEGGREIQNDRGQTVSERVPAPEKPKKE